MKIIIVLAVLVAMLYAETFKMETRSKGSVRARLLKASTYHKYLKKQNIHRSQVLAKGSQKLYDYYDEIYIGNVTVGTPGQTFGLMLDTGSSNVWLIDATCVTYQCNGDYFYYYRRKFDSKKSSTFVKGNTTLFLKYASGWSGGPLVKDTVSFGGLTIEQQEFVDATGVSDNFAGSPFDGILGLGWPALSVGAITPPMQNLLPSLDAPLFTIWLNNKLDIALGGNTGLTTYGAIDTTNCHSKVGYAPLTSETYWQFAIDGFSIGSFSLEKSAQAISDTGNSWFGAPTSVVKAIANVTNADYDPLLEIYSVDCSMIETQPDFVFTINTIKYKVPPQQYIQITDNEPKECTLALFETTSGGLGPAWILGNTWIRTFCNIYDIGQKRIGFAKAIHSAV